MSDHPITRGVSMLFDHLRQTARYWGFVCSLIALVSLSSCSARVDEKDKVICVSGDCSAKHKSKFGENLKDSNIEAVSPVAIPTAAPAAAFEAMPVAQETPVSMPTENSGNSNGGTLAGSETPTPAPKEATPLSTVIVPAPSPTPVPAVSALTAMVTLRDGCQGCHGKDGEHTAYWRTPTVFDLKTTSELAAEIKEAESIADESKRTTELTRLKSLKSFEETLGDASRMNALIDDELARDDDTAIVFQAIENKVAELDSENVRPRPMRPAMDDDSRQKFITLLTAMKEKSVDELTAAERQSFKVAKGWCVGCHSPGGSGAYVWDKAESDAGEWKKFAESALETVRDKRMPPAKLSSLEKEKWLGVLAFFQRRMPNVVADARLVYHGQKFNLGLPIDLNFVCQTPLTGRDYINQLTLSALNRNPTLDELKFIRKLDAPVEAQTREILVNRLQNEWKEEFKAHGLKKFAYLVVNSHVIRNPDSQVLKDPALQKDIADEFYMKLLRSEEVNYRDILLSNTVWASRRTGEFYGADCKEKTKDLMDNRFLECDLTANGSPRRTFFSTMGFLAGKPSSLVEENNNYGRVARMVEVIRGQPLRANTAGEQGGTVKELPSCLKSKDRRYLKSGDAPRGTMSVPQSGNFCQGCHIHRNLAAGAVAFRPFGLIGDLLLKSSIKDIQDKYINATFDNGPQLPAHENIFRQSLENTKDGSWYNKNSNGTIMDPLTDGFFAELLDIGFGPTQEKACIVDGAGTKISDVTTLGDLVQFYMKDEQELVRGLSRIIPRALVNRTATSTEVGTKLKDAWKTHEGRLLPMLAAYYATDTFACKFE